MTINGYVAQPNGKNDWMTWNPDEELIAFMRSMLDTSETLLLGRKTADGFIKFWEDTANENPTQPFAKKIAAIPKIVFSQTLGKSTWNNTTLAKGNLAEEITSLKKQNGKDILVFGGAGFVSSLIKEGLIDEYYLIVNPTAISNGMTILMHSTTCGNLLPYRQNYIPGAKLF